MSLSADFHRIKETIDKSMASRLLPGRPVTLLAASKGQSAEVIAMAIDLGITDFGENRVAEAYDKWGPIKQRHPHIRLHLIGPLQSNKVKEALELFDVIQTVDRPKLAEAIAKAAPTKKTFFIQVNTGKEPQKSGVLPQDADALIELCQTLGLAIAGLMCIPPADQPPAPHFAYLRSLAQSHGLDELSMGMSDDFETAIRLGSTCIRLGRALFGQRPD
jgi:pyridoxal phosphate enzyme (YggS family)